MLADTKCQGCGATGGVLIIDADGTFCSKCRQPKADPPSSSVLDDLEPPCGCGACYQCRRVAAGLSRRPDELNGSIVRLRAAVTAFYGSDEAEPAPDVLEAREVELDQALRFWLLAGMPS